MSIVTLDLDSGRLKWEEHWIRSYVFRSRNVVTTVVEEKDTISYTHVSKANQDRSLPEWHSLLSGFEWPKTYKNVPCPSGQNLPHGPKDQISQQYPLNT